MGSEPAFERADGPPLTARELVATLRGAEEAPPDRPYLLLNMVLTVDGRAAVGGRSGPIGDEADRALFQWLRTVPDAVLAGTGTVRTERYGRLVRDEGRRAARAQAGLEPDPLAVLITRSFDVPWDAPLFAAPEQRVVVITGAEAAGRVPSGVAAAVEVVALGDPTPAAAFATLRARHSVRSLLCEGGPTLNRALFEAGLVDELFTTFGPLLTGDHTEPGLVGLGPRLEHPLRLRLRWLLRHGDEVFMRYGVGGS